jgi:hypothetical protein
MRPQSPNAAPTARNLAKDQPIAIEEAVILVGSPQRNEASGGSRNALNSSANNHAV